MTNFGSTEWYAEVVRGNIPGMSMVHKFGEASVGTSLTPVCTSGFYRTPTSATALELVSTSANDAAAGTGAREVTIMGLDSNWEEVSQTVVPNGTTAVALSTDLVRLYRWYVSSSGTYADQTAGSHGGDLTIQESGGGNVWSTISDATFPEGQSQIGAYTVPANMSGYLVSLAVVVDSNRTVDALFFQRPNADDVTSPYSGAMRLVNKFIGISNEITLMPQSPSGPFVGPCDIGFLAAASTGTADVSVDFEILLEDTS